jgi:uncharacterized protein
VTTPRPTKVALLGALALTAATLAMFGWLAADGEVRPGDVAWLLFVLAVVFLVRVVGQVIVFRRSPRWLPAMEQWHLMPYRYLLPTQLLFLGVMVWLIRDFFAGSGAAVDRSRTFGLFLVAFSLAYALSMAVRYVVRMARRPEERWFGGTIPIVFHLVLASFLFVIGAYHVSHDKS